MDNRKLVSGLAVVAAVAGGGLAGAALGVPGISGAEETPTTTPSTDTPSTEVAPDPVPEGPFGGRHFRGGPAKLDAAADALNLTVEELRTKLADGETSIADVAEEQGVALQTVIDAMVAAANEHIDQKVADGDLTAEEATERKAEVAERITEMVNAPFVFRGPGGPGGPGEFGHHHRGPGPQLDVAAEALGMTTEELATELRAGKSIADVAAEKNVDVNTVIDALTAEARERITDMVNGEFKGPEAD